MTDPIDEFFEALERRRYEPLLEKVTGILRIDLREDAHTDHWLLRINKGDISVAREDRQADSVVGTDPELFRKIIRGEENALAAMLRGAMTVAGDLQLIVRLERLFPGPPGARGPRRALRETAG